MTVVVQYTLTNNERHKENKMTNTKNSRVLVLAPIGRDGYFGGAARKVVKRLTPAEFSTYKLQKNEEFDFSQFQGTTEVQPELDALGNL